MKSVLSYSLNMFAIAFWILRVIVLVCATMKIDFPVTPIDVNVELPILFITVFCLALVIKKNLIGALLYLAIYVGYFSFDLFNAFTNSQTVSLINIFVAVLGIVIPLANFLEIFLTTDKKTVKSTKKTDWFYQNKQFDRKLDERADKNNYRIH